MLPSGKHFCSEQERKTKEQHDGNGAAAEELSEGVVFGFDTCPISKNCHESHQGGGNIKTEIKKQEDRTCRAASVCAEFDMKSFIKNEDQCARKEIFQTDEPHSRGSVGKDIGHKTKDITGNGKEHSERALAVAPFVFEMRDIFLKGICHQGKDTKKEEGICKLPSGQERVGAIKSNTKN